MDKKHNPINQDLTIKSLLLARMTGQEWVDFMLDFKHAREQKVLNSGSFYRVLNGESGLYKICAWIAANSRGHITMAEMVKLGFCEDIGIHA